MSEFVVGASILFALAVGLLVVPWFLARSQRQRDSLTNTQVVRQRLQELDREQAEGLLSEQDKQQAELELKVALADEAEELAETRGGAKLPVLIGALLAIVLGGVIYQHASQLEQRQHWQQAMERLPELGRRVVVEGDQSIEMRDLQDFALGIRTKLAEDPSDATGWLLLGRLYAALNRIESALHAYEKSLALNPTHTGTLTSYSQALIMTGEESYMRKGQRLLAQLVEANPGDTGALGMLAITASQLGDTAQALESWKKFPISALLRKEPKHEPRMRGLLKNTTLFVAEGFIPDFPLND